MPGQPPSRTRFYLDKRNGKVMGVCAGVADYTGFDVTLVRIIMVAALLFSSGGILPIYFIAGVLASNKPRELASSDPEQQRFWQGVRVNAKRSTAEVRSKFREIDRRLADVETLYTSRNTSLANEIESLR